MAGKAWIASKRRAAPWEEALTTTMYTECTKELCIVLSSQRFFGSAPECASKVVYEGLTAHMLLEQVAIEEELEDMLTRGAMAIEAEGIHLGRDLREDTEDLLLRRSEQAEWAKARVMPLQTQLAQRRA